MQLASISIQCVHLWVVFPGLIWFHLINYDYRVHRDIHIEI